MDSNAHIHPLTAPSLNNLQSPEAVTASVRGERKDWTKCSYLFLNYKQVTKNKKRKMQIVYTHNVNSQIADKCRPDDSSLVWQTTSKSLFGKQANCEMGEEIAVVPKQQRCQANARERYRTHRYYRLLVYQIKNVFIFKWWKTFVRILTLCVNKCILRQKYDFSPFPFAIQRQLRLRPSAHHDPHRAHWPQTLQNRNITPRQKLHSASRCDSNHRSSGRSVPGSSRCNGRWWSSDDAEAAETATDDLHVLCGIEDYI